MEPPRKRLCQLLGFLSVASILLVLLHPRMPLLPNRGVFSTSPQTAANATLGFGAVVAVSHAKSPRRNSLLYAANLTDIEITIPAQPEWTDEDLTTFRSQANSRIEKGSALAWLGHLNALKWFLSTTHETALILEDDVDWSIHLRRSQIPLAAAATRSLLNGVARPNRYSPYWKPIRDYWAPLAKWELLVLGHCRDYFPVDSLSTRPLLLYKDATAPAPLHLNSELRDFMQQLHAPPYARLLYKSHWPLCTFAYAVNRASAQKILDAYSTEGEGGCAAYDVRILEACRDHGWNCYTVTPELFHHVHAPSLIADVNEGITIYDEDAAKQDSVQGKTSNIVCGARDPGWYSDDEMKVKQLKEDVRMGHCVVEDGGPTLHVEDLGILQ